MIVYNKTPLWQRLALPMAAAAVAAGAYFWWAERAPADGTASGQSGATGMAQTSAGAMPFGSASTALGTTADGRPNGVSPEDWSALTSALAKQPNSKGEAERIVSYLQYQHDFEFWQSTIDSKNVEKRHQMANALLAQLPERVAQGEFTGAEGALMGTVLLGDLEPDEAKRQQRVDEWTLRLSTAAPQPTDEKVLADHDRLTELKRRRAVAYLEWQAKAPGERSTAQLEKALDEAQQWFRSGAQ